MFVLPSSGIVMRLYQDGDNSLLPAFNGSMCRSFTMVGSSYAAISTYNVLPSGDSNAFPKWNTKKGGAWNVRVGYKRQCTENVISISVCDSSTLVVTHIESALR